MMNRPITKSWVLLHRHFPSNWERNAPLRSEPLTDRAMEVPIMNTNLQRQTQSQDVTWAVEILNRWDYLKSLGLFTPNSWEIVRCKHNTLACAGHNAKLRLTMETLNLQQSILFRDIKRSYYTKLSDKFRWNWSGRFQCTHHSNFHV